MQHWKSQDKPIIMHLYVYIFWAFSVYYIKIKHATKLIDTLQIFLSQCNMLLQEKSIDPILIKWLHLVAQSHSNKTSFELPTPKTRLVGLILILTKEFIYFYFIGSLPLPQKGFRHKPRSHLTRNFSTFCFIVSIWSV